MPHWKSPKVRQFAATLSLLFLTPVVADAQPGRALVAGDEAPNFQLNTVDGKREVALANFERPVVLFFGSFT